MRKVVLALLLLNAALFCFSDDYYESNILGMMLREVDNPSMAETEFVMKVTRDDDGTEIKTLFRDGLEFSRTEIKRDSGFIIETTAEKDRITTVKREKGIIVSEAVEYEDGTSEETRYNYRGRRLITADFLSNGETVYSDRYFYTDQGRLLNVNREYRESSRNKSLSFIFSNGRISRFWLSSSEGRNYIRFDGKGIVYNESMAAGGDLETRQYFNLSDGGRQELITDKESGASTRLTYDNQDRLVESVYSDADGNVIERSEWLYKGLYLDSYKTRRELTLEVFRYEWSADGALVKEIYLKNGSIIQETEYEDVNNYTELLYRNGRPVLKIKYADGKRQETVQLQD